MSEIQVDEAFSESLRGAFEAVGKYMGSFALMESSLNKVIGAALSLDSMQTAIITANMNLKSKIKVARTCFHIYFGKNPLMSKFDEYLLSADAAAQNDRNTLAHNFFFPSDDGEGITFYAVKATKELKLPRITWTSEELESKCADLHILSKRFEQLAEFFTSQAKLTRLSELPKNALTELIFPSRQSQPLQETLDSANSPPSSEKAPESAPFSQKV